jgi:hypothetical protein
VPDFDGGHYFLTVLAPVRTDRIVDPIPGRSRSHRHQLAQKLSLMFTGRQTEWSPKNDPPSPFAGNALNHFARFVIIDGPAYNGRLSGDTLVSAIRKINPLAPQPVDGLSTPYLLFAADIDAAGDGEAALHAYTDQLWQTMERHLRVIFDHCVGFENVETAAEFYQYIRRCQVETTMPFNDYWPDGLDVGTAKLPTGALLVTAIVAAVALVIWLAALLVNGVFTILDAHNTFAQIIAKVAGWGVIIVPLLIGVVLLGAYMLYRWILHRGSTPFPSAPGSDLSSVLKALFVQQHFTRFAIEVQGVDEVTLHQRFGAFLDAVRPSEAAPTQPPGEIRAPAVEWVR